MSHLVSVMYHYVRNTEDTVAPRMNAVREDDFVQQLDLMQSRYEVVGLDTALAFLRGEYASERPLCCVTFDDGLVEHARFVTDELARRSLQGVFFLPTACTDRECVLPIHKNHLLMGRLAFDDYHQRVMAILADDHGGIDIDIDPEQVARTYRWDKPDVGQLKYLLNYKLDGKTRDRLLKLIFEDVYGPEADYADKFYLSWDEARDMVARGMALGGHTSRHPVLSRLDAKAQTAELESCRGRLAAELPACTSPSFSYPHGKLNTFDAHTVSELKRLGFNCSFTSEVGHSAPGEDAYFIKRIDPKDLASADAL